MTDWVDYHHAYPGGGHTVSGTLKVWRAAYSPQLDNRRDVLVYLPPSYWHGDARYPVIYMHDGQNVFDAATSFVGEWGADETLERLSREGIEAIVVGLPNVDGQVKGARLEEYSPFPNRQQGITGRGDAYLDFICGTVKPVIDADFRTRPGRLQTGIIGSSMGGLISLYAFFSRADTFGLAGVLSPSLWFPDDDAIFTYVAAADPPVGRIYLDVGTAEGTVMIADKIRAEKVSYRYLQDARVMRNLLERHGYRRPRDLLYVEADGACHNEAAWAARLPRTLRFLLRRQRVVVPSQRRN